MTKDDAASRCGDMKKKLISCRFDSYTVEIQNFSPQVELLTLLYNFQRMTWRDGKKWKSINQHQPSKQTMKIPFVLKHKIS